jgi:hypothetical protein
MPLFDLPAGHDSLLRELEGMASIKSGEISEKSPGETSVRVATLATFLIASIAWLRLRILKTRPRQCGCDLL